MRTFFSTFSPTPYCREQRLRPWRAVLLVCLFVPCLASAGVLNGEAEAEANGPGITGESCAVVAALEPLELLKAERPRPGQNNQRPISERELRRPITEQEMRLLLRALEPVEPEEGRGQTIRVLVESSRLHPERMRVLSGDVTALLADLHAQQFLAQLSQLPGVQAETRAWFEETLAAVHECAEARFDERGGARALHESLRLVEEFRPQLEKTLLESLRLKGPPSSGPGGPP